MLNAFVGWYQEKQAGDIVEQLKAGIAMKATVVRNGQEQDVEAREIVPGDIIIVEEGASLSRLDLLVAHASCTGQTVPGDGRVRHVQLGRSFIP